MRCCLCLFTALLLLLPASAHPGRTDRKGGHYDRQNGGYHYHHGYPAHSHPNRICPYDYDDQTGKNSGSPSNGIKNEAKKGSEDIQIPFKEKEPEKWYETLWDGIKTIFVILLGTFPLWIGFVAEIIDDSMQNKNTKSKK